MDETPKTSTDSANPYEELYIYYLEGVLKRRHEPLFCHYFLGNWVEDDTSFLFFSRPAKDIVEKIIEKNNGLKLNEEFRFTYEEWQGGKLKPVKFSRFLIVPPWENVKGHNGDYINILLNPGVVFGTTLHTTTKDCLLALVKSFEITNFEKVLDLGTGTGILSIAAVLLGAAKGLAVDINPLAVHTALENVKLNRLEDRVEVREERAEKVIENYGDLLVANIQHDIIADLIKSPYFLQKKCFILSGLMRSQAKDIRLKLSKLPVKILREWNQDMIWHTIMGITNKS